MDSLLAQTLYASTPLTSYMPLLALIVTLYLAYKVFVQKDRNMVELMTTQRIIAPVAIFLALALAPSGAIAVFGGLQQVMTFILQIATVILTPFVVIAVIAYILNTFYPQYFR